MIFKEYMTENQRRLSASLDRKPQGAVGRKLSTCAYCGAGFELSKFRKKNRHLCNICKDDSVAAAKTAT